MQGFPAVGSATTFWREKLISGKLASGFSALRKRVKIEWVLRETDLFRGYNEIKVLKNESPGKLRYGLAFRLSK